MPEVPRRVHKMLNDLDPKKHRPTKCEIQKKKITSAHSNKLSHNLTLIPLNDIIIPNSKKQ